VALDRVETGRLYCMDPYCVARASRKWAEDWRMVLVPKQGYTWMRADDDAIKQGRSSGRT